MKRSNKGIITCAVTGSIHTPTMSPHLPITPDEIAEQAIAAAEAGAAMLHLHARDPETDRPNQSPALFQRFLPRIKQSTDAQIPRHLWFLTEPLPRNATGKFLKRQLRESLKPALP
jgi:uncharacterized protein (DUF849 family)